MFRLAPAPREGETLYSVLARLGQYLNVNDASPFMEGLVGRRSAIASSDLPGNLTWLVRDLDEDRRETAVDRIIDRLTGFPFHTAFMPEHVRASVRTAMRGSVTGVYTALGLAAFKVRPPGRLRFCPKCLDDMEEGHADLWWSRDHQLPGVFVCAKHGLALRDSQVDPGERNRHSFVAATRATCTLDAVPSIADADHGEMGRLAVLAALAAQILERPPEAMEHSQRSAHYRDRLERAGLMRSAHKVDLAGLHAAFRDRWGAVSELVPGLGIQDDLERSWLTGMVRTGRRAAHPLQHLMLGAMLDGIAPVECERTFGSGPWQCRNPVAEHFGQAVIGKVVERRDRGVVYGDLYCSCGYLYTVSRRADGTMGQPRYRSFGPLLVPALSGALAHGESLRTTARTLGLDPKTLMREAEMAGVKVPWSLKPSGVISPARVISEPAPRKVRRSRTRPRRNWFAIDTRLARAAGSAAKTIVLLQPPVRVTFAELERRIARRGWVLKRRAKLPRTTQVMEEALESVDGFRRRRIEVCVVQALAAGDMRPCEVLRAAGLPSSWLPLVRDALEMAKPSLRIVA